MANKRPRRSSKASKQPASPSTDSTGAAPSRKPATPPQIAVASDGRILLSVADLSDCDLTGRETFISVFLTPEEARPVIDRVDGAAADAASRLASKLAKR
jgi:hypothetical protein